MSIEIREKFEVDAPIEAVWALVMNPEEVAPCLPGAKLDEVVDERNFLGGVKIKIGAITTQYKGKVELTKVDEASRTVEMAAEGRETSGGTAKAVITSKLAETASGSTEVIVEANADLTGKVMQVGSRMIEGVSKQLFKQFAKRLSKKLESERLAPAAAAPATPAADGIPAPSSEPRATPSVGDEEEDEALSIVPIILRAIWDAIAGFFRNLFGGRGS